MLPKEVCFIKQCPVSIKTQARLKTYAFSFATCFIFLQGLLDLAELELTQCIYCAEVQTRTRLLCWKCGVNCIVFTDLHRLCTTQQNWVLHTITKIKNWQLFTKISANLLSTETDRERERD